MSGMGFFTGFVVGVVVTTLGVSGLLLSTARGSRALEPSCATREFHDYFTGRK